MPDIAYLGLFNSGGAANVTPTLSLGGAMSETLPVGSADQRQIVGQRSGAFVASQGSIYHLFRFDTAEQVQLQIRNSNSSLTGAGDPDLGIGRALPVSTDAGVGSALVMPGIGEGGPGMSTHDFNDGSAAVYRRTTSAVWPALTTGSNASVTTVPENMFDDVGSSDAWLGLIDYRMFYFANLSVNGDGTSGQRFHRVKLWIDVQPTSAQIDIGFNIREVNTEPTAIVDKFTAPAGITFVDYDSVDNALEFEVIDGLDKIPLWFRRTVFPGQSAASVTDDFFDVVWEATG